MYMRTQYCNKCKNQDELDCCLDCTYERTSDTYRCKKCEENEHANCECQKSYCRNYCDKCQQYCECECWFKMWKFAHLLYGNELGCEFHYSYFENEKYYFGIDVIEKENICNYNTYWRC